MRFASLILLAVCSALSLELLPLRDSRAYACSLAPPPKDDPLRYALEDPELVIVGEVVDERPMPGFGEDEVYTSRVKPDAVLKGDPGIGTIDLHFLNYLGGGCEGGPRLPVGQRVLLFLSKRSYIGVAPGIDLKDAWQMVLSGGKVLLEDGYAYADNWGELQALGAIETVITRAGQRLGATPEQTEAALRAAVAPSEGGSGSSRLLHLTIIGLGLAFAAGAAYALSRRQQPDQ